jgi:hypothetical protein
MAFWDWLFERDVLEYDRTWHETNLREGRTARENSRAPTQRKRCFSL